MPKYLVLYKAALPATEMMESMTPEQRQTGMELWMKWSEKAGDALVDFGMPLGTAKHVESGSISPSKDTVTGFSIIQAGSLDEAATLVEDHPHFHTPGESSIEVHEFLPMPGM